MLEVLEDHEVIRNIENNLLMLKVLISGLCSQLKENMVQAQILTQNFTDIEHIEDLEIPYRNFYYDEEDIDGNKVNTYYGYICAPSDENIIDSVRDVNLYKDILAQDFKALRTIFKSNPPKFNKIISSIDHDGQINIKEITRHIVLIESDDSPVLKVSFQPEIINKGKGRCLTGGEIKFVLENYFVGSDGKYAQDLNHLTRIKSNELLSPIGAERRKCRVNVRTELETFKGKYCSIPVIILSRPATNFKTNLNTIFEKQFKKVRVDQQLEEEPFLAFRSFTRKKTGYKVFLTKEELEERESYLTTAFD